MSVVDVLAQTGETYHFVTEAANNSTTVQGVVAIYPCFAVFQVFLPSWLDLHIAGDSI